MDSKSLESRLKAHRQIYIVIGVFLLLFIPVVYTEIRFGSLLHYDPFRIETYNISASLKVRHFNGTVEWISFELDNITTANFPDLNLMRQTYMLTSLTDGLNATFSVIHLIVFIPEEAYTYFREIECHYQIEQTTNLVKRSSNIFSFNGHDYTTEIDITNVMFKDAVPDQVTAQIILFNR